MDTASIQSSIALGLQRLRKERGLTQGELSAALGVSQARLSKIENGHGSLTAEQLVWLLQQYGLALSFFVKEERGDAKINQDEETYLQNALVRLGATHLRVVPGVAVPERLESPEDVILETLVEGTSRSITALAPVIVRHCDKINFQRIAQKLRTYGFGLQYRIWWAVDATYLALEQRLQETYLPRTLHRLYQKAFLLLERKKLNADEVRDQVKDQEDELDRDLISKRTLQLVGHNRDRLALDWRIITRIKQSDFEQALKDAEEK